MEIKTNRDGASLTVTPVGRIDTVTSPELEALLEAECDGVEELVFDFGRLDYISSAGLRLLLIYQKKMNSKGKMKVVGANETVKDIFDVTGFSDFLDLE